MTSPFPVAILVLGFIQYGCDRYYLYSDEHLDDMVHRSEIPDGFWGINKYTVYKIFKAY